jgi:hypothetical protein
MAKIVERRKRSYRRCDAFTPEAKFKAIICNVCTERFGMLLDGRARVRTNCLICCVDQQGRKCVCRVPINLLALLRDCVVRVLSSAYVPKPNQCLFVCLAVQY